jgi:hypothetical protein
MLVMLESVGLGGGGGGDPAAEREVVDACGKDDGVGARGFSVGSRVPVSLETSVFFPVFFIGVGFCSVFLIRGWVMRTYGQADITCRDLM